MKGPLALKMYKSNLASRCRRAPDPVLRFDCERDILGILSGYPNFPMLLDYDRNPNWILMENAGDPLSYKNKPPPGVFHEQLGQILRILEINDIQHGDLNLWNFLWDHSHLILIDFCMGRIGRGLINCLGSTFRKSIKRLYGKSFLRTLVKDPHLRKFFDESAKNRSGDYEIPFSVYKSYFHSLQDRRVSILEVGLLRASRLIQLLQYFPRGHVVVLDTNISRIDENLEPYVDRIKILEGDPTEYSLNSEGPFNLIIDRWGETPGEQWMTFCNLVPHLDPMGCYYIESIWHSSSPWREVIERGILTLDQRDYHFKLLRGRWPLLRIELKKSYSPLG